MKTNNLVLLFMLAVGLSSAGSTGQAGPIPADCRTGGFALGCQAWTFREFTVLDAIDKTAAAGGKVIELYSGQKFSAEKPGVVFDHNASDEIIAELKARLQKDGIRAVNYGVVPIPNNEAEARKIFDFAKKLGRREWLRGTLSRQGDQLVVERFPNEGSGIFTSIVASTGLIELTEERESVKAGDLVDFLPFSALLAG